MNGVENHGRLVSLPQGMWCGSGCADILDNLEKNLAGQGGLVVISGAVGVGKSLLLDCYNKYLKETGQTYYFMSAGELRDIDFFNVLASGLGIQGLYTEKLQFIVELSNYLYSLADKGQKLTLVIDDCERLSQSILDVLRLIVQVEKDGVKIVQLILSGRRKVAQTLAMPRNASLLSCCIYTSTLEPFSQQETAEYIAYRLDLAGYSMGVFGFNSLHLIHRATGGRVGEINRLCEYVLQYPLGAEEASYDISTICNSIDALSMDMGMPEDEDDTVLPIASKKVEPVPVVAPKIPWEEAVQVAARQELGQDLQEISGTEKKAGLIEIFMGKKTKKWWALSVPTLVVLGLCVYLVVPSMGSKEISGNLEHSATKRVKNNRLLQELVDEIDEETAVSETVQQVVVVPAIIETEIGEDARLVVDDSMPDPVPVFAIAEDVAVEPKSPPVPVVFNEEVALQEDVVVEPVVKAPEEEVLLPEEPFVRVMRLRAGSNGLAGGARQSLQDFLAEAELFPAAQIIVKGYVSSNTVSQENTEISIRRATVIHDMLVEKGISAERIRIIGMGVQNPVAPNTTVSGRNKNRRVVLELLAKEYVEAQ